MDVETAVRIGFGGLILLFGLAVLYAVWPLKTRPQGGGKSAGYARAGAEAEDRAGPEAADNGPESASIALGANGPGGRPAALSGTTPSVVRAALTPDCPSLDSEFWRANPTEPLAPSEVVRFKAITDRYEWVATAPVVPGGESCRD